MRKRGGSKCSKRGGSKRGGSKCVTQCRKMHNCKDLCSVSMEDSKDIIDERIRHAKTELSTLIDKVEKEKGARKREIENILDDLTRSNKFSEDELKFTRSLLENMNESVTKKKEHIDMLTAQYKPKKEKKTRKYKRRGVYIPFTRNGGGFWGSDEKKDDEECENECIKKRDKMCDDTCDAIHEHIGKKDQVYHMLIRDIDHTKLLLSTLQSSALHIKLD